MTTQKSEGKDEEVVDFQSLVEQIPQRERRVAECDVSDLYGKPPGSIVFRWQEPNAPQMFEAAEYAPKLRRNYPDFPLALCIEIATMALTHLAPPVKRGPGAMPAEHLYCKIAETNTELYARLYTAYKLGFPELNMTQQELAERKNS